MILVLGEIFVVDKLGNLILGGLLGVLLHQLLLGVVLVGEEQYVCLVLEVVLLLQTE
jgi:hypothetical protein